MKNSIIIKHKMTTDDGGRTFELFINGKAIDGVRSYKVTGHYDDVTEVTITLIAGEIKMLIEGATPKTLQLRIKKYRMRLKAFLRRKLIKIY